MENEKMIKVVMLEPGKLARAAEIDASLAGMQKTVGGLIEPFYPFEEQVYIVCNEESKINGMRPNRSVKNDDGVMVDFIFGPAFICDCRGENLDSLSDEQIEKFTWMGISGIANVLCCIKFAKYYELTEDDVVVTVLTDSAVMYKSRVEELNEMYGAYSAQAAELDHNLHMLNLKTDSMLELTYPERKRVHNLKYYTWVEQQGMTVEDLNAQWYDTKNTWDAVHAQAKELDELINAFNDEVGLLKAL